MDEAVQVWREESGRTEFGNLKCQAEKRAFIWLLISPSTVPGMTSFPRRIERVLGRCGPIISPPSER